MFGLLSNNNNTPQPALMSQGVNRTANLPPALQSDVAKMRNAGVPEQRINDYITNRLPYFSTFTPAPAPALNAAASSSTAPAPVLGHLDEGDASVNIDGTPINDSNFVKVIGDAVRTAVKTGDNAKPRSQRQTLPPPPPVLTDPATPAFPPPPVPPDATPSLVPPPAPPPA